jgi:hypothetical protein
MKSILMDIVAHTHKLGFLNIARIRGTEEKTTIESMADDRSVVMYGQTIEPHQNMIGVFGMPQLEKLKYLLDCQEYQQDAKIELVTAERNGDVIPVGIHFENKDGDFNNDYRFMNEAVITEKLKTVEFNGPKWDIELTPTMSSINRFQYQVSANSEHTTFLAKTEGDQLKFMFGDASSHGGEFVFFSGVTGKLNKSWAWPVAPILSILKLAGANTTVLSFSNNGVMQITLDSGVAVYRYIIPAKV